MKYICVTVHNAEPSFVMFICSGEILTVAPKGVAVMFEHMATILHEKLEVPYYRLNAKTLPESLTDNDEAMAMVIKDAEKQITKLSAEQTLEIGPGIFVPVGASNDAKTD